MTGNRLAGRTLMRCARPLTPSRRTLGRHRGHLDKHDRIGRTTSAGRTAPRRAAGRRSSSPSPLSTTRYVTSSPRPAHLAAPAWPSPGAAAVSTVDAASFVTRTTRRGWRRVAAWLRAGMARAGPAGPITGTWSPIGSGGVRAPWRCRRRGSPAGSAGRVGGWWEPVQPGGAQREVALLGRAGGHLRRPQVGLARRCDVARTFEQVCPYGFEAVGVGHPVVGVEGAEQGEAGLRAVHHGQGDGAAERGYRSGRHLGEDVVQGEDLRPVGGLGGRGLVVHGGDGGLQLVGADGHGPQGGAEQRLAFGDAGGVPQVAALLGERHDRPVAIGASCPAGIGEQHQREQPGDLALAGSRRYSTRVSRMVSVVRSARCSAGPERSEEHTSELQSRGHLVCRLLLEKKKKKYTRPSHEQKKKKKNKKSKTY